jgi:RHS repeat-associated protein
MLHFKHATAGSRWPMYDAVGTARRVVDDSRAVTDAYSLDAFGVEFASATGSTPNPYRYGGAWGYITDGSGLLQLGARFYWPELGRFIQQDPVGDGMNWYVYANGNPVVFIDPSGLTGMDDLHLALDGLGLVPAYGEIADVVNAAIYAVEGNWGDAGLSATAAIPLVGWASTAGKGIKHGSKLRKGVCRAATEMHHGTPGEVLRNLPAGTRKLTQGTKGRPNRIRIPRGAHRTAHSRGYNAWFKSQIEKAGGYKKVSPEQIWEIRRQALKKFFGIGS